MNYLKLLVLFIAISHQSLAQENKLMELPVTDLTLERNDITFHKITQTEGQLWSVDYGNGLVFTSEDDGINWKYLTKLGSEYLEAVQFLDKNTGFVCGDYGFVYKTKDGGQTWTEISPEIEDRITTKYRNGVDKSKEPFGMYAAYYGMHFSDENHGFVSGFMFNPAIGSRESFSRLFFKTEDGGENWVKISIEEHKEYVKKMKAEVKKTNMTFNGEYFQTPTQSWQTQRNKEKEDIIISQNYKTEENQAFRLPKTPFGRIMLRSITFLNDDLGYIFGGSLDAGNTKAVIYQTTDGGKTWKYIPSEWPHIHTAYSDGKFLWIMGKENLMKRFDVSALDN